MATLPPNSEPLPGTVKLYHRHLLICTGPVDWPENIETGGGFLQTLTDAIARRGAEISAQVKVTACDEPTSGSGFDILVFPDNVRYYGVQKNNIPALVEEQLVNQRIANTIPHQPLTQQYVVVCTHGRRDIRCGECGPPLRGALEAAVVARQLADKMVVRGSSHVGGHMFAGNVLVYPAGDWYGYVTPADAPRLVEHISQARVVADLWRGRMGLTQQEQLYLSLRFEQG
jgi:hypothetical protein